MIIVYEFPPHWAAVNAKFGIEARGLKPIFAWGNKIYNPYRVGVSRAIMAHEVVHGDRQSAGIEDWWNRYLDDDEFRLTEEVVAHRAEYEALLHEYGNNRVNRRLFLSQTAQRLRAPLYLYKLPIDEARRLLKDVHGI